MTDEPIDMAAHRRSETGDPSVRLEHHDPIRKVDYCRHWRCAVDLQARRCTCKKCGASVDAWHVIGTIATLQEDGWRHGDWIRSLRKKRADLKAEVEILNAERAKIRAAIKREGGRLGKLSHDRAVDRGEVVLLGTAERKDSTS